MKLTRDVLNSQFYSLLLQRLGDPIESLFLASTFAPITDIIAGDLETNPVVEKYIEFNLVTIIVQIYQEKWNRIYAALYAEYNPIHNYDLNETGENFRQVGGDSENYVNFNESKSGNDKTITANGKNDSAGKIVNNITVNENGATWSYETGDMVKNSNYVTTYDSQQENLTGSDQQQGQSSSISTVQDLHIYDTTNSRNGEIKHEYSQLDITLNSPNSNVNVTPTEFTGNNLKRSGNIGVTTTQQMINAEIEMRFKYQLATIIINDCIDFCSGGVWS